MKNAQLATFMSHAWDEVLQCMTKHPEELVNFQANYWLDYMRFITEGTAPPGACETNSANALDEHAAWDENIYFRFIKQAYGLQSDHIKNLVKAITEGENERFRNRVEFFSDQMLEALSPLNFPLTNPQIVEMMLEGKGLNLLQGTGKFIEDLTDQHTEESDFVISKNIACTPGRVVYQNDLMQLIEYTPTTKKIFEYPLLIVSHFINKYYIFDLQQENSLVKWLVDNGFHVFITSWVNPNESHRHKGFTDYIFDGAYQAMEVISKLTGTENINLVGYCISGTLLGCLLGYLAKKKDTRVKSATFLTTLFDFSNPGQLGGFIDRKQIDFLEDLMNKEGFLDGRLLKNIFNSLRPKELIWSGYVTQYLKGDQLKPHDIRFWSSDPVNVPQKVLSYFLTNGYLENAFIKKNALTIGDEKLDLSRIDTPTYFLAAKSDNIVPWEGCFKSQQQLNGPVRFVLTNSGHVGGVINPPSRHKYSFLATDKKYKSPATYLRYAPSTPGSWWTDWLAWLSTHGGNLKTPPRSKNAALEHAPGSYMRNRL
jgi:polyhydroxyalkanoate synthase